MVWNNTGNKNMEKLTNKEKYKKKATIKKPKLKGK